MYEYNEQQMVTPDEFSLPFGGTWHPNNCCVKLAQLIPREKVEELYLPSLKDTSQENKAYLIRKAPVTRTAGFISSYLVKQILDQDCRVLGIDNMNDSYDVELKYSL